MMAMDSGLLRLLWSVVEEVQSNDLLQLSDGALVALLLQQISQRVRLNREELERLGAYIGSRLALIRDMADSR